MRLHIHDNQDDFFVNEPALDHDAPYKPGVREIWLKRTLPGTPYGKLIYHEGAPWSAALTK